jgi:hypothetical protein
MGEWFPTFLRNIVHSTSRVKRFQETLEVEGTIFIQNENHSLNKTASSCPRSPESSDD